MSTPSLFYLGNGYYRNMNTKAEWRYRKAIEQALSTVTRLRYPKAKALARCIILRAAQWALDGRRNQPSIKEFRNALVLYGDEILDGARELRRAVEALPEESRMPVHCVNGPVTGLKEYFNTHQLRKPKLVLTSPPYPGIHVLYHRWLLIPGEVARESGMMSPG
jgi:hypothetical protein